MRERLKRSKLPAPCTYGHGWFKVAFANELNQEINAVTIGSRDLILVRQGGDFRAFPAHCPHRGTNLAHGGRVDGDSIICPFHHFRIRMGGPTVEDLHLREYRTLSIGGLVFVRLSELHDNAFPDAMQRICQGHVIEPGFVLPIKADAKIVIENGFDQAHFRPIHDVAASDFTTRADTLGYLTLSGEIGVNGSFRLLAPETPGPDRSDWSDNGAAGTRMPFVLRAFSPGLSVLQMGGRFPYVMIVGATPTRDGCCVLRLSVGLPHDVYGELPDPSIVAVLLERSKAGIIDDQAIWENMFPTAPHRLVPSDAAVAEFRRFCTRFEEDSDQ
jgi:3-ketosteroid 9alpha-monooxygenase subunit A